MVSSSGNEQAAFYLEPVDTPPEPRSGEVIYVGNGDIFTAEQAGIRPVPMIMPEVAGIHLGGCIRQGVGTSLKLAIAHAHISSKDSHMGWICFRSPQAYYDPKYEYLMWHEYAHILSQQGHTEKWREIMRRLGQPIPKRYEPRKSKSYRLKK